MNKEAKATKSAASSGSKSNVVKYVAIALGVLLLGLGGVVAFMYFGRPYSNPENIRVTNVTDRSVTVSWKSEKEMPGVVVYSEEDDFMPWLLAGMNKKKAYDDRDVSKARLEEAEKLVENGEDGEVEGVSSIDDVEVTDLGKYYVHHVTITNLEPETEYYFMLGNGYRYEKATDYVKVDQFSMLGEDADKFTTYAELDDIRVPNPSYGGVVDADMEKVTDAITFMYTDGNSPVSSVLNEDGKWYIDLSNIRVAGGESYAEFSESSDSALLYVMADGDLSSEVISNPMSEDAPVGDIVVRSEDESDDTSMLVNVVRADVVSQIKLPWGNDSGDKDSSVKKTDSSVFDNNEKSNPRQEPPTSGESVTGMPWEQQNYDSDEEETDSGSGGDYRSPDPTSHGKTGNETNYGGSVVEGDGSNSNNNDDVDYSDEDGGYLSSNDDNDGGTSDDIVDPRTGPYDNSVVEGDGTNTNDEDNVQYSDEEGGYVSSSDEYTDKQDKKSSFDDRDKVGDVDVTEGVKFRDPGRDCVNNSGEPKPKGTSCGYIGSDSVCNDSGNCVLIAGSDIVGNVEEDVAQSESVVTACGPNDPRMNETYSDEYARTNGFWTRNMSPGSICPVSPPETNDLCPCAVTCDDGTQVACYPGYRCNCPVDGEDSEYTLDDDPAVYVPLEPDTSGVQSQRKTIVRSVFAATQNYTVTDNFVVKPEEDGVYSVSIPGVGKYDNLRLLADKEYSFFVDDNGNGVYEKGEELVEASGNPIELTLDDTKEVFKLDLVEGLNFVSLNHLSTETDSCKLIEQMNKESNALITQLARFESGKFQVTSYREDMEDPVSGECFPVVPGRGYVLRSFGDEKVALDGYALTEPADVSFDTEGWHLIGVNGTTTVYTAESLIDSVNEVEGLTADNVTHWLREASKYEGLQKEEGNVYGFDYAVNSDEGYFVRVSEGSGVWSPEE